MYNDTDVHWLHQAVHLAEQSIPSPAAYCVGAILIGNKSVLQNLTPTQKGVLETVPRDPTLDSLHNLKNSIILSTGYSRELPGNTHAEEVCFIKLNQAFHRRFPLSPHVPDPSKDPRWHPEFQKFIAQDGITLYSTMEPCTTRLSGRPPCCKHILDLQIQRVVMGIAEPKDIFVNCTGMESLKKAGIGVEVIPGLEEKCWNPNRHIRAFFSK